MHSARISPGVARGAGITSVTAGRLLDIINKSPFGIRAGGKGFVPHAEIPTIGVNAIATRFATSGILVSYRLPGIFRTAIILSILLIYDINTFLIFMGIVVLVVDILS